MGKQSGPRRRDPRPDTASPEWHEYGDFFLSFGYVNRGGMRHPQTRAYYSQGDLFMAWDGIVANDELLAWINEQAAAFLPPAERKLLDWVAGTEAPAKPEGE